MLAVLPNNWERLAPITLPRKKPVSQFVIDRSFAKAAFLQPFSDLSNCRTRRKSVENWRIDRNAIPNESDWILVARRLNNLPNRQIKFASKLEIALIVGGNSLDRAGAVAEQNVIGDPDRNFFLVSRIDCKRAGEDAGFFFRELGPLKIALARGLFSIFTNRRPL